MLSADDDDRIHDEHAQSKLQCREYITSKLGTGPQPVLETLKYQVCNLLMFPDAAPVTVNVVIG